MKHDSMNTVFMFKLARIVGAAFGFGAEPTVLLEETFEQPLSAD